MAIKLEVGKRYELNNGEVHECTKMNGNDPLAVDCRGYGPFVINGMCYHQDGRWAAYSAEDVLSVKRCVSDDPKLWRDMTPEEKGALLLAYHEGKVIQSSFYGCPWSDCRSGVSWNGALAYRVKPEPVAETVALEGGCYNGVWRLSQSGFIGDHTHRITFDVIDGVPDCDSIKMEKLP